MRGIRSRRGSVSSLPRGLGKGTLELPHKQRREYEERLAKGDKRLYDGKKNVCSNENIGWIGGQRARKTQ